MALSITINMRKYLENGGKLENIEPNTVKSTKNAGSHKPVIRVEDRGDKNSKNEALFYLIYDDGSEDRYSPFWLEVTVEVELDSKYKG